MSAKRERKQIRKGLMRQFDSYLTHRTVTGAGNDGWVFFLLQQMEAGVSSYVEMRHVRD